MTRNPENIKAAEPGYEYIITDAIRDTDTGYPGMEGLIEYAHSKKVDVFLWYNSNGTLNGRLFFYKE